MSNSLEKLRKCEVCAREFKTRTTLVVHIKKCHMKIEDYYREYVDSSPRTVCVVCNGPVRFDSIDSGWALHCSHRCSVNDPKVAIRRNENYKKSLFEKYGVTNPGQLLDHEEKRKKTCLERYGDENFNNVEKSQLTCLERFGRVSAAGTDEYMEKVRVTCRKKYGCDHHLQSEVVKEKIRCTSFEHYGFYSNLSSPEIRKQITDTTNRLYGGYTLASPELRKKFEKTMIERYGTVCPLRNESCRQKKRETSLKRYGTEYPNQSHEVLKKILSTQSATSFRLRLYKDVDIQSRLEESFVDSRLIEGNTVENGPVISYEVNGKKRMYHVDFLVTYRDGKKRLIEVKEKHGWFRKELANGTFLAKVKAAQQFSKYNGFLPFKVWFCDV